MMSLNRYRLKHLVNQKHKGAMRATQLLSRPDRLIGVILIGNNLANNFAAIVAATIAIKLYGQGSEVIAGIALTIVMLIVAEVTPKTVAALYPEKIAFPFSLILKPLLSILYPAVWAVNYLSNGLAHCFGINTEHHHHQHDHLHPDELRTVVDEAGGLIPDQHQGMLLNILDLGKVTVDDIMIPRNDVEGLNLDDNIPALLHKIRTSDYTRLPVYKGDINHIVGILHLRNASRFIFGDDSTITEEAIRRFSHEPYFIPEGTPLSTQLLNFQQAKRRMGIVVDEYGDVQGIVTLEDLLEEIVGDFTTNLAEDQHPDISPLSNGWHKIDASVSIREINRQLDWYLPTDGPKTLNGLLVEILENIPDANVGLRVGDYLIETLTITDKKIESARANKIYF